MRKFIIPTFVVASLTALLSTTPVHAQATRTWVSGVGDDANPCSRTAPCKTFAGAISKTATKGEINVLDPGGFGGVTITKSITIASEYVEAGVLVSGTNGIIINGAGVVVTLRGLDIEGVGTGLNGINFLQGSSLHVQNCTIRGFNGTNASGISFTPGTEAQLFVTDTIVMNNGQFAAGNGIVVRPTGSGNVSAVFTRVNSNYNTTGFKADGSAHTGNIHLSIRESSASGNTQNGVLGHQQRNGRHRRIRQQHLGFKQSPERSSCRRDRRPDFLQPVSRHEQRGRGELRRPRGKRSATAPTRTGATSRMVRRRPRLRRSERNSSKSERKCPSLHGARAQHGRHLSRYAAL